MSFIAESKSLFEIDEELDELLEEIQEEIDSQGQPSSERLARFEEFCGAHKDKVDRIGRFLRMMEARTLYCRSEANRLQERARSSERKCDQTKVMVLYYLESRGMTKVEGLEYTLRKHQNSQNSVRIIDEHLIPIRYKVIEASVAGTLWEQILDALPESLKKTLRASLKKATPNTEAIKQAPERVPGTEVRRGSHLRIA
jgi:Siphovirus Gp157